MIFPTKITNMNCMQKKIDLQYFEDILADIMHEYETNYIFFLPILTRLGVNVSLQVKVNRK